MWLIHTASHYWVCVFLVPQDNELQHLVETHKRRDEYSYLFFVFTVIRNGITCVYEHNRPHSFGRHSIVACFKVPSKLSPWKIKDNEKSYSLKSITWLKWVICWQLPQMCIYSFVTVVVQAGSSREVMWLSLTLLIQNWHAVWVTVQKGVFLHTNCHAERSIWPFPVPLCFQQRCCRLVVFHKRGS